MKELVLNNIIKNAMSHSYYKVKYNTEGDYGSINEEYLYADHNASSDYVIIYDNAGDIILVIPDTMDNNILDAINKIYAPYKIDKNKCVEGVEKISSDELKNILNKG
jgi:hypothetical protein